MGGKQFKCLWTHYSNAKDQLKLGKFPYLSSVFFTLDNDILLLTLFTETRMEMLAAADMAWTNFLGDDFSVEDLLIEPEQEEWFDQEVEADSLGTSNHTSSSSAASFELHNLSMELDFHASTEDVADLEWVSRFVDDSLFEFPAENKNVQADHRWYATPVTSLLSERPLMVPVKARSRRSRTASNLSWSSSNSCSTATSSTSHCTINPHNLLKKQKRGRKKKMHDDHHHQHQLLRGERKCGHCGMEKTLQWRAGPMGAKTLCNACGVRFKSGRLLPEYRPAGSPTFVSSVHSNSHRKVMEMRRKKADEEQQQKKLGFSGRI